MFYLTFEPFRPLKVGITLLGHLFELLKTMRLAMVVKKKFPGFQFFVIELVIGGRG